MIKSFNSILMSNVFVAAIKFLILYLIILFGTTEDVGVYSYGLAIVSPIFLLSSLKIKSIVITEGAKYENSEYLMAIIFFSLITLIFSSAFIMFFEANYEIIIVTVLLAIQKAAENIKYFFHGIFTRNFELRKVAKAQNITYLLSFVVFFISYYLTNELIYSLSFYVLSYIGSVIIEIILMKSVESINTKKIFSFKNIYKIFLTSFPLSFSSFIGSFTIQLPRYFIRNYYDLSLLGIFSSLSYVLVIINLFANSLSQVFLPKLKQYANNDIKKFNKIVLLLCSIGFFGGLLFTIINVLIGKPIINIVFGEIYGEYHFVLILLSVSITIQLTGVFIGTGLIAQKIYKFHSSIYFVNLITVGLTSSILIPKYALEGAAISLLIGNVVTLIFYLIVYIKYFKGDEND